MQIYIHTGGEYATRIYNSHKRHKKDIKNERLIIHKNRVVKTYVSINGKRAFEGNEDYYITIDGKRKMIFGFRDVSSVYYCRNELKGTYYDRKALFESSRALGHNRESIVA